MVTFVIQSLGHLNYLGVDFIKAIIKDDSNIFEW